MEKETKSHVNQVTDKLIEDLTENGSRHVLQWIDGYYERMAEAILRDKVERSIADIRQTDGQDLTPEEKQQVTVAIALKELVSSASLAANYSTGQGANLLSQASIATAARILERNGHFYRAAEKLYDQAHQVYLTHKARADAKNQQS